MNTDLDRTDFEILYHFQKNARLSNKEIAVAVGLAPSTCLCRTQRLREAGILGEAHAEVASAALGIGLQALVSIRLRQHSRPQVKSFWKYLRGLPEVLGIYHLAGGYDFLVHVAVRDAQHMRDLAMDSFTTRSEVSHIETSLIFEFARNPVLPNYSVQDAASTVSSKGKRFRRA